MKNLLIVVGLGAVQLASASVTTLINFNEYAFPVATTDVSNTSPSYNVLNDATLSILGSNNGDAADLKFAFSEGPQQAPQYTSRTEWQTTNSGRFTSTKTFTGGPTIPNPGLRFSSTQRVTFGSHLLITDALASFTSLNTAGTAWEFSMIAFLKPDGSYFSAMPTVAAFNSHTSVNGSPSLGWWLSDSKGTTRNVGTGLTGAGTSGPFNDLDLSPMMTGIAANTLIGGLEFIHVVEEVRGPSNTNTSFTASFRSLQVTGQPVPEPGTLAAIGFGVAAMLRRRKK